MSDDLFPSGPWVGFYNYAPGEKHRMDLHLVFGEGHVNGDGNDDVGQFLVRGSYDKANRECSWTKSYPGSHDVYYRGFREGKGIWGTWEIGVISHGGFHIWPKGEREGGEENASAEASRPLDAISVWEEDRATKEQKTVISEHAHVVGANGLAPAFGLISPIFGSIGLGFPSSPRRGRARL